MRYSWRWFGPNDPVKIQDVMQVGAKEVVTALHHIPNGTVWTQEDIKKRQHDVEWDNIGNRKTGLKWTIVESLPVHEDIKKRSGNYEQYIANYKESLKNLGKCGIHTVIYNFMPVLDWTRTDLAFELPNGAKALKYDESALAAFDLFILKRPGAEKDFSKKRIEKAEKYFAGMSEADKEKLTRTIIAGLPGAEESFTLQEFQAALDAYKDIDPKRLRKNMVSFLREVIPAAEKANIRMGIHPDDPPRPIFGLPRVMSNISDMKYMLSKVKSLNCGLNLCAGSLGVDAENDLVKMIRKFRDRVHFVHLRSVRREGRSFMEDEHIAGSVDLFSIIKAILKEEDRRRKNKCDEVEIPIRPDHGHQMLDDLNKKTNPGYSCIGRMKGLAEIRGMALAIERMNIEK